MLGSATDTACGAICGQHTSLDGAWLCGIVSWHKTRAGRTRCAPTSISRSLCDGLMDAISSAADNCRVAGAGAGAAGDGDGGAAGDAAGDGDGPLAGLDRVSLRRGSPALAPMPSSAELLPDITVAAGAAPTGGGRTGLPTPKSGSEDFWTSRQATRGDCIERMQSSNTQPANYSVGRSSRPGKDRECARQTSAGLCAQSLPTGLPQS
jgi:hypothetical protein